MGCKEIDTSSLKLFRLYVNCGSWSSPKDPGSCARPEWTKFSIQRFESFELMIFKDCRVDILRGLYSWTSHQSQPFCTRNHTFGSELASSSPWSTQRHCDENRDEQQSGCEQSPSSTVTWCQDYESAHECPSIGLERGEMESTRIHLCAALLV